LVDISSSVIVFDAISSKALSSAVSFVAASYLVVSISDGHFATKACWFDFYSDFASTRLFSFFDTCTGTSGEAIATGAGFSDFCCCLATGLVSASFSSLSCFFSSF